MKKIALFSINALLFLTLSGCFGSSTSTTSTNTQTFTDTHFTIEYPSAWTVKTRNNFDTDIPQATVAIFSNPDARDGYRTTISIINDLVPTGTTSLDYAKANINNATQGVLSFIKIEERDLQISGLDTKMLIFQGKSDFNAKTLKYIQAYVVQAERGYTITASDLLDIDDNDFKILQELVASFQLLE